MSVASASVAAVVSAMIGWSAAAHDFVVPTLLDVAGVPGGALNVRDAPDNGAEVVGPLLAREQGVEVVASDPTGYWGLVNVGARSGWVALQHLAAQTGAGPLAARRGACSASGRSQRGRCGWRIGW